METLKTGKVFKTILIWMFFLLFLSFPCGAAEVDGGLAKCAEFKDDPVARLECFDNLAKQQTSVKDTSPSSVVAAAVPKEPPSVMSKQWDLDVAKGKIEDTFFKIRPYRPMYFLPVAYNSSPNEDTALDFDKNAKAQYNEAKFQLSFKMKPWGTDIEGIEVLKGIDIWLAYTQLAFWQVYNSAFSAPFRDTNYEPELLINLRTDYHLLGLHGRILNLGFNHQSNGRSVPLSRSWNRLVANVGLENEKGDFNLLIKTWYRIPENENNDDNPDITRYMGYGELWGTLYWKKQRFAVMLRNNFRQDNLGAVQLDWSVPFSTFYNKLTDKCSIYLQYYNGYGESLLDYNKSINRISIGFMLANWNWDI
jgi:phospholipase A1